MGYKYLTEVEKKKNLNKIQLFKNIAHAATIINVPPIGSNLTFHNDLCIKSIEKE